MKNTVRNTLAKLSQVAHVEKHEFHYVPGANPQADAAIEAALAATAVVPEDHWTKRFRGPKGLRRSSIGGK